MFEILKNKYKPKSSRVYLDFAAATPIRNSVLKIMDEVSRQLFANPSAVHQEGVLARNKIDEARLDLARALEVKPEGIIFTASGTESNNLAIFGLVEKLHLEGREYSDMAIISSKLEHPSVSRVLDKLSLWGVKIKYVKVDYGGRIDFNDLGKCLDESVVLCTFSYVNSEIGVIQDIGKVSRLIHKFNKENGTTIKVHTDAAQAPLWLSCRPEELGVDMLSLDASKCYGPKGVGVLVLHRSVDISPVVLGGGQEQGLRAATENTPAIIGAAAAIVEAQTNYQKRSEKITVLRDKTIKELKEISGAFINGSLENRVANNINISIADIDGEFAVISLDAAGFAVSTKSACSGSDGEGSKVVMTIIGDKNRASSTIRITLGEETKEKELKFLVKAIKEHIKQTRKV